ncbi:MAG: hypothetical protein V4594_08700 [Bacteroidota bacterium]
MKLQTYEQTAVPGAGTQSVSLINPETSTIPSVQSPKETEEDLWQEISDELARGISPVWRMWR